MQKPFGILAVCGIAISGMVVLEGCGGRGQRSSPVIAGGESSAVVTKNAAGGVSAGAAPAVETASESFTPVSIQARQAEASGQGTGIAVPEIGQGGGNASLAAGSTSTNTATTTPAQSSTTGTGAATTLASSQGSAVGLAAASASAQGTVTASVLALNSATSTSAGAASGAGTPTAATVGGSAGATSSASAANSAGGTTSAATTTVSSPLEELVGLMCGEFSSAEQAARDPDYRDISLKIARIWPRSSDGAWLYVEQAVATMADRPYRQRIYHVTQVPGTKVLTFRSEVYTLPGDPKTFVGAWREPSRFASMTPAMLVERQGCAVILTQSGPGSFRGSTVERNCQSEFQKASYATSEVMIDSRGMVSWDRGFDHEGKQVWGATHGGYTFLRVMASAPAASGGAAPPVAQPEK